VIVLAPLIVSCSSNDSSKTVKVGVLLPLTGGLQSNGLNSQAALELARDTLNKNSDLKIELVIKDTTLDPNTALAKLEELHGEGINVVIGPYASSEVTAVKDYADQNGIVIVSPLSTAGSLSVPDNIFRFIPDDSKEGEAVAHVAADAGVKTIVPVTRDDAGNKGLQIAVKRIFEAQGGTIAEGVTYGTDEQDFDKVAADVLAALQAAGGAPGETAVYLTGFDEVISLFKAATALGDPLDSVTWYGSDSLAQSPTLIGDPTAAAFAAKVGFPNPILGLRDEDQDLWGPVVDDLTQELGHRPDAFALAAYDALVVIQETFKQVGAKPSTDAFKTAFVKNADNQIGLTGPTTLNDAGDRSNASFDFWAICPDGSSYTWKRTISYAVSADGTATVTNEGC
jgi:branched-chain amino acid transport system substrate-binding protein